MDFLFLSGCRPPPAAFALKTPNLDEVASQQSLFLIQFFWRSLQGVNRRGNPSIKSIILSTVMLLFFTGEFDIFLANHKQPDKKLRL